MTCSFVAVFMASCDRPTPTEKNLLTNPSFEKAKDNVPVGWKINNFRGLAGMKEARYNVNERQFHDGEHSFNFFAESDTKRFFTLSQEVAVKDLRQVRVRAWIKTVGVDKNADQYPQAGIGLTYYNKFRGRFDSRTFADVRTKPLYGTTDDWKFVEEVYRLPQNVAFIELHCVLGMEGRIWFDEVSLDVPEGLPWNEEKGDLFTRYWLEGTPYPDGSLEFQEKIYRLYASRLGISPERMPKISYYYYPSVEMLQHTVGTPEKITVDYDRHEIHTAHPADDHEIVHLLTDVVGRLPRILAEGTAFYLMDDYEGEPIQPLAQKLLRERKLPPLRSILKPFAARDLPAQQVIVSAASFVGYLLEYGGTERFKNLHELTNADMDYDDFAQVFPLAYNGGSLEDAEGVWRATLASADFSKFNKQAQEEKEEQEEQ